MFSLSSLAILLHLMFLSFSKLRSLILLSPLIHLVPSSCCSRSCLHHSLLCCCMLPPFPSALLLTSLPIRCLLLLPYTLSPFSLFFPSPPLPLLHLSHLFSLTFSFTFSLTFIALYSLHLSHTSLFYPYGNGSPYYVNGKNIFENIILFFSRKRT